MEEFNLETYLAKGVENIVKEIVKVSLFDLNANNDMLQFAKQSMRANKIRKEYEEKGTHIPPFLIASITSQCNLHCQGCYARANHNCFDGVDPSRKLLTTEEWERIFIEAENLGISFILLIGGEPMMRTDVMEQAKNHKGLLFPFFTNGTLLNEKYVEYLKNARNLLPILSIEGKKETTDARRGAGTFDKLNHAMELLHNQKIMFGSSITLQKDNMSEVTEDCFVEQLLKKGCKAMIYVEYVPTSKATLSLAPGDKEREYMEERLRQLREKYKEMIFIAFPGDEKSSGGCLAAGRGFFHINPYGGAEPCPFSTYSDTNIRNASVLDALRSPLFTRLHDSGTLNMDHIGGCVLYEQEEKVKEIMREIG